MKIAVAGATGSVGRHIVDLLEARGHEVVRMSRASGVDVVTGKGLADALRSAEVVIDASSSPTPDEREATEFFTASAARLQEAGAKAGVKRIVLVSIIGIEKFKGGYYAAKVAQEKAMLAGPVPVRIVRSTQFHELVPRMIDWGRQGDVAYVPEMRTQLVAAQTAAEAIADVATQPSADDAIVEIGGPRVEQLLEAARRLSARRRDGLRIEVADGYGDRDSALYATDVLLPGPRARLGGPTFEAWLEATH